MAARGRLRAHGEQDLCLCFRNPEPGFAAPLGHPGHDSYHHHHHQHHHQHREQKQPINIGAPKRHKKRDRTPGVTVKEDKKPRKETENIKTNQPYVCVRVCASMKDKIKRKKKGTGPKVSATMTHFVTLPPQQQNVFSSRPFHPANPALETVEMARKTLFLAVFSSCTRFFGELRRSLHSQKWFSN